MGDRTPDPSMTDYCYEVGQKKKKNQENEKNIILDLTLDNCKNVLTVGHCCLWVDWQRTPRLQSAF